MARKLTKMQGGMTRGHSLAAMKIGAGLAAVVMIVTGSLWIFGFTHAAMHYAALVAVLAAAAATDLQRGVIPNELLLVGALAALGLQAAQGPAALTEGVAAGLAAAGCLLGIRVLTTLGFGRVGLGMGDVKLGGLLGLYLGWPAFWALYLAAVLGGIFGAAGLLTGRLSRTTRLPFAPFIAVGTCLHVVLPVPL